MRRLIPLLLLACTDLELKNYACGALCRESGQSELGQWSEQLDDCTCQVKGNFEGMRSKKLIITARKRVPKVPKPHREPVSTGRFSSFDFPQPPSAFE